MGDVSTDLLDLASSLIQVIPDPTALSDIGAFTGEQLLQYGVTEEIPALLDKIHPIIDSIPFVGKTNVVKAMETVGEAHELISVIGKAFEEFQSSI